MTAGFRSKLVVEDDDGFPFTLTAPLVYDSAVLGQTITVPIGFKTDFASIPRALWNVLPPVGSYDRAAVIHDLLYQQPNQRPGRGGGPLQRGEADAVLNEAMQVCGVGRATRWLIYSGVRVGGWAVWRRYRSAQRLPPLGPLAAAVLLLSLLAGVSSAQGRRTPDPALTPGATRPVTLQTLCTPGSAGQARKVSSATKKAVFARYHVTPRPGAYEVDHLISLELGGSNDVTNLWPQPYHGAMNAHDKDRLENQLHALVCRGTVSLAEAQHAIATDWISALHQYGGKAAPR